jgi:uncharacterized membrane protein YdjX (TVP38/TMEM64 family)
MTIPEAGDDAEYPPPELAESGFSTERPPRAEEPRPRAPWSHWIRYGILLLLAVVVIAIIAGPAGELSLDRFQHRRTLAHDYAWRHPVRSVAIYLVAYFLVSALAIPGAAVLTMIGGDLFGPRLATLYTCVAATGGATMAFLLSRWLLRDTLKRRFPIAEQRIEHALARDPIGAMLALRLAPVFPFWMVNLVAGLSRIPVWIYVLTTATGIIPGTLVYAFAGRQVGRMKELNDVLRPPIFITLCLLACAVLVPGWLAQRWKRRGFFTAPRRMTGLFQKPTAEPSTDQAS